MNKKKFFGLLTAVAMLLNAPPLSVLAEEMVEVSGVVGAVTNADGTIAVDKNNFPDEKLLAAIKDQNDGIMDAAKVTKLSLMKDEVKDFSGLQYLTGLNNLEISNNTSIEALNLSTNTELTNLILNNNVTLYSVTLPQTQTLSTITITNNPALTTLDLSPASVLTNATISNNAIAQLDVSNNAFLNTLVADSNKLYALDTTACPKLSTLNVAGNKIYELKIVDKAIQTLNVAGNKLREFDGSKMNQLSSLNIADNMLESINLPTNENISYLNVDQNHLASLNLDDVLVTEDTPQVKAGNQSLFAREEDEAIDLKAYDNNFKGSNAKILDKNGKPSPTTIKNGVLPLVSSNSGNSGGGTTTPPHQPTPPETPSVPASQVTLQAKLEGVATPNVVKVLFEPKALTNTDLNLDNAKLTLSDVVGTGDVKLENGTIEKVSLKFKRSEDNSNEWIAVPDPAEEVQSESGSSILKPWRVGMGTPFNIIVTGVVTISGEGIVTTSFTFQVGSEENGGLKEDEYIPSQPLEETENPTIPDNPDDPDTPDNPNTPDDNPDNPIDEATNLTTATVTITYTGTGTKEDPYVYTVTINDKEVSASDLKITPVAGTQEAPNPDADGNLKVTVTALEGSTAYSGSKEVIAINNNPPVEPEPVDETIDLATVDVKVTYIGTGTTTNPYVFTVKINGEEVSLTELKVTVKEGAKPDANGNLPVKVTPAEGNTTYIGEANVEATTTQKPSSTIKPEPTTELTADMVRVLYTTTKTNDSEEITNTPVALQIENSNEKIIMLTEDEKKGIEFEFVEGWKWEANISALPKGYKLPPEGKIEGAAVQEVTLLKSEDIAVVYAEVDDELQPIEVWVYGAYGDSLSSEDNKYSPLSSIPPNNYSSSWAPLGKANSFDLREFEFDKDSGLGSVKSLSSSQKLFEVPLEKSDPSEAFFLLSEKQLDNVPALIARLEPVSGNNFRIIYAVGEDKVDYYIIQMANYPNSPLLGEYAEAHRLNSPYWTTVQTDKTDSEKALFEPLTLNPEGKLNQLIIQNPEVLPLEYGTAQKGNQLSSFYSFKATPITQETLELTAKMNSNYLEESNAGYLTDISIEVEGKNPVNIQNNSIAPSKVEGTCTFWFSDAQCMLTLSNLKLDSRDEEKDTYSATVTVTFPFYNQMPIDYILPSPTITEMPIEIKVGNTGKTESSQITPMSEEFSQVNVDSVLNGVEAAAGYAYEVQDHNNMMVYVYKESIMNRLYNPNSGEHFYTKDINEKNTLVKLGWQYEGVGWVAPKAGEGKTTPVYRLYNANIGDHHYTKDAHEKDTLVKIGWTFEGVGWYSPADPEYYENETLGHRTIEVFREYNPNAQEAGSHNYTISENENATLVSIGWIDEGIAWNALK